MQNDLLHRYFAGVLRLRHFLQLQEGLEAAWQKLPVPKRLGNLLVPVSFAAAALTMLCAALRAKQEQRKREDRFPFV